MKRIVILGSSAAGVAVVEEIRARDVESEITIFALDGHFPYNREAFASFITQEIAPEDIFCRAKDFYEQHKVNVVLDKVITRINLKRKKIFTDDKHQIDYDILIVTDTPENRFPEIKGINKGNVFGYRKLKDIETVIQDLPLIETIVIQSGSFSGIQAALALAKWSKDVVLVSPEGGVLTKQFDDEMNGWLISQLEEKGVQVSAPATIDAILGDKDAKAVRLDSGKVFAADVVVFVETDEDLRLFSASGIQVGRNIGVDANFKTNIDDLFAVDTVSDSSSLDPIIPTPVLEAQGKMVAAVINGQERSFIDPVRVWSLNAEGLAITVLGKVEIVEGVEIHREFDLSSGIYKGLYTEENRLIGAILVNQENEREEILRMITEKIEFHPVNEETNLIQEGESEVVLEEKGPNNVSAELIDN